MKHLLKVKGLRERKYAGTYWS